MIRIPLGSGGELVEATFLARPNRFLVEALLDHGVGEGGAVVAAHLADRGRLKETLVPGARLLLARRGGAGRKTAFQAVAAYRGGSPAPRAALAEGDGPAMLVSLDTHLPNRLIEAALRMGALPQFGDYPSLRREVRVGASRFDFQLSDGARRCTVEVKSAGLVVDGMGLFPDAPTERGRRHLRELAALARAGERTALVFVVQGGDARAVRVDTAIDTPFAEQLRLAAAAGVEIYGCACPLTPEGLTLGSIIAVLGLD